MSNICWRRSVIWPVLLATMAFASPAIPVPPSLPQFEPVAETRLLMEGLAQANFRGLERLLKTPPKDAESWVFARGQALLIAETGNLLMLRPPHNQGQAAWQECAADMRAASTRLAVAAAGRDYAGCRARLSNLANSCNRCHQTFRVKYTVRPFAESPQSDELPIPRRLLDNGSVPD